MGRHGAPETTKRSDLRADPEAPGVQPQEETEPHEQEDPELDVTRLGAVRFSGEERADVQTWAHSNCGSFESSGGCGSSRKTTEAADGVLQNAQVSS